MPQQRVEQGKRLGFESAALAVHQQGGARLIIFDPACAEQFWTIHGPEAPFTKDIAVS
jgi:hypothetical protein